MSRFSWISRWFRRWFVRVRRISPIYLRVMPLEDRVTPVWSGGLPLTAADFDGDRRADIVTGSLPGEQTRVTVRSAADGRVLQSFLPFGAGFKGGASVAVADFNRDGLPELVVGAGPGGGPHVRIFNTDGDVVGSFFAYAPIFSGGVSVATGDVDGDGTPEIVTGAGPGGGPHVKVFNGVDRSELPGFFAYDKAFHGGVSVSTVDWNNDGRADIVTGAGPGGGPHVKVFDGKTGTTIDSFFSYVRSFDGGVAVSAGDVNGDGKTEIITAPGARGGPHYRAFGPGGSSVDSAMVFAEDFSGGVVAAAGDVDGDGRAELIVGGPNVRVLDMETRQELDAFRPPAADYAAIKVPGNGGALVDVTLRRLESDTQNRNEFGVFVVDDADGRVNGLLPGDVGYAMTALRAERVRAYDNAGSEAVVQLQAGGYFGFYLIRNSTVPVWRSGNPTNTVGSAPIALFSFPEANPDRSEQMLRPGRRRFAFNDDLRNDRDFNDMVVSVDYADSRIPEPPTPQPPTPPTPAPPIPL